MKKMMFGFAMFGLGLVAFVGCVTPKPSATVAAAPAIVHPSCPDGETFLSWTPAEVMPGGAVVRIEVHGSTGNGTVLIPFPHGLLECKRQ